MVRCSPLQLNRPVSPMAIIQGGMGRCFPECPAAHAAKCQQCTYSPEHVLGENFTLLLPELLVLRGLSGTEGSLWPSLFLMTHGKRKSKRKTTTCLYLSSKKGRQDWAVEPAVYPLWLLTKSWQPLWFIFPQTQGVGPSFFSYSCKVTLKQANCKIIKAKCLSTTTGSDVSHGSWIWAMFSKLCGIGVF